LHGCSCKTKFGWRIDWLKENSKIVAIAHFAIKCKNLYRTFSANFGAPFTFEMLSFLGLVDKTYIQHYWKMKIA
jgi:hypothetical protein